MFGFQVQGAGAGGSFEPCLALIPAIPSARTKNGSPERTAMHVHIFDHVLGTTSKVRLLRTLLPLTRPVSGREAARLAGVSQTAALRALDELVAIGVLERKVESDRHHFVVNRDNPVVRALPPLFRAEAERWQAILALLRRGIVNADLPLRRALRAVAAIDDEASSVEPSSGSLVLTVVAIVSDPKEEKEANAMLSRLEPHLRHHFGLGLVPLVLTLDRFRELHASGDPATQALITHATPISGDLLSTLVADVPTSPH